MTRPRGTRRDPQGMLSSNHSHARASAHAGMQHSDGVERLHLAPLNPPSSRALFSGTGHVYPPRASESLRPLPLSPLAGERTEVPAAARVARHAPASSLSSAAAAVPRHGTLSSSREPAAGA